jgi:broad specificity phosphatase PhoE
MNVIVVRHGETEWNASQKIQGQTDVELSETGRAQAVQTAQNIQGKKIDLILTSSLKRASETAEIINGFFNVPVIADNRIIERSFGDNEGKTKTEIDEMKKQNPLIDCSWDYNKNVEYDNIENVQDFFKRVYSFLDEIVERFNGKNILIVTHGGVTIPMHCYFNRIPLETVHDSSQMPKLKNCDYVEYIIDSPEPPHTNIGDSAEVSGMTRDKSNATEIEI